MAGPGGGNERQVPSFMISRKGMQLFREGRLDIVDCVLDGLRADGTASGNFARLYWDGEINEVRAEQRAGGDGGKVGRIIGKRTGGNGSNSE